MQNATNEKGQPNKRCTKILSLNASTMFELFKLQKKNKYFSCLERGP